MDEDGLRVLYVYVGGIFIPRAMMDETQGFDVRSRSRMRMLYIGS